MKPLLKKLPLPPRFQDVPPVPLTDATMTERLQKVLAKMVDGDYDHLIIYADKEHGSNFEYLTGFFPRFEEALLVIQQDGSAHYIMGNENLKMVSHARLTGKLHHSPLFSLPNQPMEGEEDLAVILQDCGIASGQKIGLVGWKLFTTKQTSAKDMVDLPMFIVEAIKTAAGDSQLENAASLFIGEEGARVCNNANEVAHYEYGAQLASKGMQEALAAIQPGIKETQLGALLNQEGQLNNVVTIAATGARFEGANFYPTNKEVQLGDAVSLTVSYKGGLSSRTGFAIENQEQLPAGQSDYLEKVIQPYFQAVTTWLEEPKIGITGGELYRQVDVVYPKAQYGWHLNPGHLVADEEWLASPVYEGSMEILQSGMLLQVDLIPSVAGYQGTSTEECVLLADLELQEALQQDYPQLWQRIIQRRNYIIDILGIEIHPTILPMSNLVGYLPPFLLAKGSAMTWK